MSRRSAFVSAVALVASVGLNSFAPAQAASVTCTGTGQATLGGGIGYYPVTVTVNVTFRFTVQCTVVLPNTPADAPPPTLDGFGTLTSAACGRSSGSGTITGIGDFALETAGTMLILTPRNGSTISGAGNAIPVPDTSTVPFGNSCSNGTASVFQLTGSIAY